MTQESQSSSQKTTIKGVPSSLRLPSLDGWRAVSIVMVLGAHCIYVHGFPPGLHSLFYWLFDGNLGVRVFFVISGLLITWLLLAECDRTGRVNLGHFYARRALRILPVYWAFLVVLLLLQKLTPFGQSPMGWVGNVTFTTNFMSDVAGSAGHLWSLGVEEQFYLLWPGLFLLFAPARNFRLCAFFLAVPILVAPIIRTGSYLRLIPQGIAPLFSNHSFFKYFDSLAIGCACAVLLSTRRELIRHWLQRFPRSVVFLALALVFVPFLLTKGLVLGIVTIPFGPSLQGLGIAILLLQSLIFPDLGFYRLLNQKLICQIGVLSYSIYIWQQIFCTRPEVFGMRPVWWLTFPTWMIAVMVVALVSYYGLERPLFRLRAHLRE